MQKGKTAIITGAAQGIGREIALTFAREGINIGICDIDTEALKEAEQAIKREAEIEVIAEQVDTSNPSQVQTFTRHLEQRFGTIDILVNNAAINPITPIEEITPEEWDKVFAINMKGFFLFAQAVIPGMRTQKNGRIINMASGAGKNGGTFCGLHYAATKGAVMAFTRHLAKKLGPEGITVNAIAPGRIATPMAMAVSDEENQVYIDASALKKMGAPEDVANAALFLAGEQGKFITGETLNVNGGTIMD